MIVTLDGPAGAGKSSAARELARRLGFEYLDTGAMYRAVTLMALRHALDLRDEAALARLLAGLTLEISATRVTVNGEDVTPLLRTAAVTAASGAIADSPAVRRRMVEWQRQFARGRDVVTEGRDQGTLVFPDAACKFFVSADPAERARRRQREMATRGEQVAFEDVLRAQEARDRRDEERTLAPMVPAPDAVLIDTTGSTLIQVVDQLENLVRTRQGAGSRED